MKVETLIKALKKMPKDADVSIRYIEDSVIQQCDARAVALETHEEADTTYCVILGEGTTI